MKRIPILPAILLFTGVSMVSCSTDDLTAEAVESALEQGTWRVSTFKQNGSDLTSDFAGYSFTFNTNGTAVAISPSDTVPGNWSVYEGSDENGPELSLNFGFGVPMLKLTKDWTVNEQSETLISTQDTTSGGGGLDFLDFARN